MCSVITIACFLTFRDTRFDFVNQIFTAEFHFRNHHELTTTGDSRQPGQVTQ
jgi:hypothetical protein